MWRLSACTRQPPGSFAACMKRFSGWLIGRHGTEWDRQTLIIHGGSGRAGSLRGDGALPTEFPMTAHFWKGLYIWWSAKAARQSTTGESRTGSRCFHLMTSLYPRFVPASALSDADRKLWNSFPFYFFFFYLLFFFNVAAGLCRGWCQCKQTQTHQFLASRSQLLYWDKVTLMNSFLPLILTVRTYFCLTISNSKTAIFYVSFCCHSYK